MGDKGWCFAPEASPDGGEKGIDRDTRFVPAPFDPATYHGVHGLQRNFSPRVDPELLDVPEAPPAICGGGTWTRLPEPP
jgi:hypothetical protein